MFIERAETKHKKANATREAKREIYIERERARERERESGTCSAGLL